MSQEFASMTAEPKNGASGNPPIVIPPEESVWRKYSANHEFPISTLTSVALHVFVVMLVVLFGAMVFRWGTSEPPQVSTIRVFDPRESPRGGGGQTDGGANPTELPDRNPGRIDDPEVTSARRLPDDLHIVTSNTPSTNADEDSKSFDRDFREKFPDPNAKIGPKGRGGSGTGGGKGKGNGPHDGDGSGEGGPALRTDRWAIALSYTDGEGLYREWSNLHAIILVPEGKNAAGQSQYRVFYDLTTKAPRGRLETVESMQTQGRIWFTDHNADSVAALARYLGYSTPPKFIAFFIPKKLEDELLAKEMAYAKKKDEAQMQGYETTFRVSRVGDRFNATVIEQKKRK